ncbi:MAG TPA: YceH family protein [Gemmataceae bacterium]|nr:YceH family protein [Gemmataceae bacterium]
MSAAPEPPAPAAWPALSLTERRVLGVLVEKAKTTPDAYPLSLNALVTGCNQKSNRDPVLNLSDVDAEEALAELQKKRLAIRITGSGRVERWRHNVYEAWRLEKVEAAVVAELLLRGPQTEGELRGRASRMEPIDDLDALRAVLKPLAERGLVVYLTPEGRRGTVLTHGFHPREELERLKARHQGEAAAEPASAPARPASHPPPAAPELGPRLEGALAEVAELRGRVADLQRQVADLAEQLRALRQALGA